jgi:malic enzyme
MRSFFMNSRKQDALDYHRTGRKGKIAVVATEPCRTQADLSLVAESRVLTVRKHLSIFRGHT